MEENNNSNILEENGNQENQQVVSNQSNSSGSENNQNQQQNNAGNSGEKTFSQEQVNKMMAREKSQGRAAALRELGIDPKNSKAIAALQSILKNNFSDNDNSEKAIAETEKRANIAETKVEIMKQGISPKYVDDAVVLVMSRLDEYGADLSTVVKELKTKYPEWEESKETSKKEDKNSNNSVGQKGTGSSIKNNAKEDEKNKSGSVGARLAAQRKKQNNFKNSYWNK